MNGEEEIQSLGIAVAERPIGEPNPFVADTQILNLGIHERFQEQGNPRSVNYQYADENAPLTPLDNEAVEALSITDYQNYLYDILANRIPAELVQGHLSTFLTRYDEILKEYTSPTYLRSQNPEDKALHTAAYMIGKYTEDIIQGLSLQPEATVTPTNIERMYGLTRTPDRDMRGIIASEWIPHLIRFDERNRELRTGEYLNLREQVEDDMVAAIVNPEVRRSAPYTHTIFSNLIFDDPQLAERILIESVQQAGDPTTYEAIMENIVGMYSLPRTYIVLSDHASAHPEARAAVNAFFSHLGLAGEGRLATSIEEQYREARSGTGTTMSEGFKNLETNNPTELALVKNRIGHVEQLGDIGCGSGRLLLELQKWLGHKIVGIDLVPEQINDILAQDPEAQVYVRSWFDTQFPDESFDALYSLGRSTIHNRDAEEWMQCLREGNRILKSGGKYVINTADPNQGHYIAERERLASIAESHGGVHMTHQAIIDSPDRTNYIQRYVPTQDQLTAMARLSGFSIQLIGEEDYPDNEGYTNRCLYWELVKEDQHLSEEEQMELTDTAKSGSVADLMQFAGIDYEEEDKKAA